MVEINKDLGHVTGEISDYTIFPEGRYTAQICSVDYTTSRKGDEMLVVDWAMLDDDYGGEFSGRTFREWLMLSGKGQKIGENKLKAILMAIGADNPEYIDDTDELLGRPCAMDMTCREETQINPEDGSELTRQKNRVSRYLPLAEEPPAPPVQAAAPARAARQAPARQAPPRQAPAPARRSPYTDVRAPRQAPAPQDDGGEIDPPF
jgi:hypothetical protein